MSSGGHFLPTLLALGGEWMGRVKMYVGRLWGASTAMQIWAPPTLQPFKSKVGACSLPKLLCKRAYSSHGQTSANSYRPMCSVSFHSSLWHKQAMWFYALPAICWNWSSERLASGMILLLTVLFFNILNNLASPCTVSVFDLTQKLSSFKSAVACSYFINRGSES